MTKIGIISDTHGMLRPEVIEGLQGCEAILHGGDINRQSILDELNKIAPVYVVRGNNDGDWAESIPYFLEFELAGLSFCMSHKKKDLPANLQKYDIVIYGHSHKWAESREDEGTLMLNPGSCGPRRFGKTATFAMLEVDDQGGFEINKIEISVPEKQKK